VSAKAKPDPLAEVAARYAVAITPAMEALIDPADARDPIAAQFRPDARELEIASDELADPIGDDAHTPVKGVVHRYDDRCLLKLVHVCPVYCRFCFRREMVGPAGDGTLSGEELDAALAYIEAHEEIWEVILTGGDPFLLSARRVREISARLAAIAHVRIIRWHTRVPAVDPLRVTPDLVAALRVDGAATYVVLHANHARELTENARAAIARIVDAGVPLLAQTVLL
jgi:lysine 2,3-aminomutase